jgi:hypothetical protein
MDSFTRFGLTSHTSPTSLYASSTSYLGSSIPHIGTLSLTLTYHAKRSSPNEHLLHPTWALASLVRLPTPTGIPSRYAQGKSPRMLFSPAEFRHPTLGHVPLWNPTLFCSPNICRTEEFRRERERGQASLVTRNKTRMPTTIQHNNVHTSHQNKVNKRNKMYMEWKETK